MSTQYPKLQFEILSPDEIRALSVAQVTHSDPQYDHWNGGLMDPRMGPTNFSSEGPEESSADCRTCGSSLLECAGHFGHIELAECVFHPGLIRKVKKVLQCVCLKCGRLKMHQNSRLIETLSAIEDQKKRMDLVWTECQKELVCGSNLAEDWEEGTSREKSGCGHIHPVIKRRALGIFLQNPDCPHQKLPVVSRRITAAWAHVILARISNDDLQILGFSHLRISADTCSRGSQGGDDGLTYKLREILRCSKSLQANEDERELQYYVASYLDSDFPGLSRVTDRFRFRRHDVDCLSSRVKSRVRQSLLGKSADFSARTCVTIDPDLAMDEVGVPKSIAMTLTYPERVTHYNISLLQTLVSNGAGTYPGARCVIDDSDKFMDLSTRTQGEFTLQYGWVVERHLQDGDFVLLSSENCSQRSNAMGHRVRVMPWSTFRLNPSIILGYGIRSGENMIIRVLRSEESRVELSEIVYVPRQMISPHNGKPAIGLSQAVCWGLQMLTSKDTFLDLEQLQNVLFHFPDWDGVLPIPAIIKPKCFWTGKQVVSVLLPRTTNYIYTRTDEYQPHIEKGELISGVFPNNDYFQLVNALVRQAGAEAASSKLLTGMQSVANSFMIHTGFSIGIGHTILDSASTGSVDENIEDCLSRVAEQCKPTSSSPDPYFERKLASSLVQSWSRSGSIVAQWTRRKTKNSAIMMAAKSHSRRLAYASEKAFTDIIRASACVGQQFVGNGFIPMGFRDRTLPHFTKHAIRPEAWGFIKNSYLRGLTPQEFFFNAMVGRAYILHVTGEKAEAMRVQRNLVKSLEDVMVCYDGTVRNSSGDVIQFVYGEDGFDPTCLESQTIDTFGENFDSKYGRLQVGTEFSELKAKLDQEFAQLIRDRQLIGEFFHDKCRYHRFSLPLNLPHLLQEAIVKFGIDSSSRQVDDLEPKHIIDTINSLCNRLILAHGEDIVRMFCMQLRATLETGRVLKEFYLSRAAFDWVLTEAEHRFKHSFVNPGEMCGLLAAQGFGEALTQRLPGFAIYRPGSSLWKRPVVIERFKEIVYASDVIDEASLTVHLEPTSSTGSWEQALIVRRQLPFVVLRDIMSATEIWYDPDPNLTVIEEDTLFVEAFFAIPDEDIALELQSPWLIRLELDRRKICDHGLTLNFVASCITQKFGSKVAVIWSEECSDKLIIRCRVLTDIMENMNDFFTINIELHRLTEDILDSTVLGGIPGIDRVFLMPYSPVKDGIVLHESEWLIETLGTNLKATLAVEGVDFTRTYSNDCIETCRVLGIEAARAILLQELHYIVGYAKVGQVERRHLVLLCDFMTRHGFIKSMRCPSNVGTLVQSAPSSRGFLEAALRGKRGFLGLTETLILGKIRRMGSDSMDILIDPSVL